MKKKFDIGVGQRLGLGFGLLFAFLLAFAAFVLVSSARSADAERDYVERITTRVAEAQELERAVLHVAITYRSFLLDGDEASRARFETHVDRASRSLEKLRGMPHDAEATALFEIASATLTPYLDDIRRAAASHAANVGSEATLDELASRRDAALGATNAFAALEARRGLQALATMTRTRDRIWAATIAVLVVASLLAGMVAWLTTRAVSRPTRALLHATGELGRGRWEPALALDDGSPPPEHDELGKIARAVAGAAGQLRDREQALERVLEEVREKNQQIQAYNEELQAQNEELHAQAEEIQSQNEELHAQAEEITAQNEELRSHGDRLREQAAALRDADHHKTQFLAVLAHELRNPMAPIMSSVSLLRRVPGDGDAASRALAVIERQARHLVRLVDDLLDVSRISQGKVRLQLAPVDLAAIARECLDDHAQAFEAKHVRLSAEISAAPVWVNGDRARLAQVLGNLVTNALKFTDAGGRVQLTLHADGRERTAVLAVSDTGIGLEPALLGQLFQPFMQGATGLARSNSGLGLGLALVKGLVSMHEGTAAATSAGPRRGAQFVVRLPLLDGVPEDAGARPRRAPTGRSRILIVEDNVDAATSLQSILELDGNEVAVAHSGAAGIALARELRPDLVICDIGLPGTDGYEFARLVRADPGLRHVLLVALTGYAAGADRAAAKQAGFDLHYAKPLDPEQLQEIFVALADARAADGRPGESAPA